jgi:hypothetical protein
LKSFSRCCTMLVLSSSSSLIVGFRLVGFLGFPMRLTSHLRGFKTLPHCRDSPASVLKPVFKSIERALLHSHSTCETVKKCGVARAGNIKVDCVTKAAVRIGARVGPKAKILIELESWTIQTL